MPHRSETPNVPDEACSCCGYLPEGCICPECPECGVAGDPACYCPTPLHHSYNRHNLTFSKEQRIGQVGRRIGELEEELAAQHEYLQRLTDQN